MSYLELIDIRFYPLFRLLIQFRLHFYQKQLFSKKNAIFFFLNINNLQTLLARAYHLMREKRGFQKKMLEIFGNTKDRF